MKKLHRLLMGCMVTCACFFISFAGGAYAPLYAEISKSNTLGTMGPQVPSDLTPGGSKLNTTETPVPTLTPTQTPTPTPTVSPTPTLSPTPTVTPTPTISPTPTVTPTPTNTPTPTLSPTPTISPTPTPAPLVLNFTMPAVSTNLHIRKGPGTNYDIIGKLPIMTYAFILEESQNGWTKITTGNIKEGYVSSDYLFTQEEIISLCDREELVHATSTAGLNVRTGPGTYYSIRTTIAKGKTYPVVLAESYDGWYAIRLNNGNIGYVSAKYVELTYGMDTGLTMKEIERLRDLAHFEDALNLEPGDGARVEANMLTSIPETKRDPITVSEDEVYLLATIIYTEAGNQKYEGKLAVANVILNRLISGRYGDTIADVVYAKGQFGGAAPELVARAQAKGIPDSCYKAAREALAGRNNIGDFRFFRTTRSAYNAKAYSVFTKFYILEDHVFYEREWN